MSVPGALARVVTATFLHFLSLYYLFPTLPLYVKQLGGSTSEVGLIIGIMAMASLAARPVLGFWMDRVGRRRFLLAGAAIYVLASLGYWAIQSVHGLLLWRVFHAMGLATFSTAAASLAGDLAPLGRRGATMGIFGLAQASALTVGPGIGQLILGAFGYPWLFVAAACTAFASLVCVFTLPRKLSPGPESRREGRAGSHGVWGVTATPSALQFVASVAYGTIISFIAVVARDRGLDVVGMFFALLATSSLGVRLAAGRAYDTWGAPTVLIPIFATLAAAMALLAVAGPPGLFLLAAAVAGLGIGGTHTTLMARVVDRSAPENRAQSVAWFTASWELGVGAGAILMGRIAEVVGFSVMFLVVAALPLLGLVTLGWLRTGRTAAAS